MEPLYNFSCFLIGFRGRSIINFKATPDKVMETLSQKKKKKKKKKKKRARGMVRGVEQLPKKNQK
jgi:hypothetical protein